MSHFPCVAVPLRRAPPPPAASAPSRRPPLRSFQQKSGGPAPPVCLHNSTADWPTDLSNKQCLGLTQVSATDAASCLAQCCQDDSCQTYQWCPAGGPCTTPGTCWIGPASDCNHDAPGWVSRGRPGSPPPPPAPGAQCSDPGCLPGTDDSGWRSLNLPHDFVVEGDPVPSGPESQGYLPLGTAWYRKHFTIPSASAGATMWVEIEAAQTSSTVYLNGFLLGSHGFGYTPSRYFLNASQINFGADNLLA